MSKKNKNVETGEVTHEADDDTVDNPNLDHEADVDIEEDSFEFDSSLIPAGLKLIDLAPDFVRPDGFLMVPRLNKKTGEIYPMTTTFVGILHDVIPWKDARGKERVWFALESTSDAVNGAAYTGQDEKGKEFREPVSKGARIGISGSGAINALKGKKGHWVALHWTGNKVKVKNGDMWEVKARVSEFPVIEVKDK